MKDFAKAVKSKAVLVGLGLAVVSIPMLIYGGLYLISKHGPTNNPNADRWIYPPSAMR